MRDCCGCSPLCVHWPSFESLVLSRQGVSLCAWFLSLQVTIAFRLPVCPEAGGRQREGWQISLSCKPFVEVSFLHCCYADNRTHCLTYTAWDGYFGLQNNLVYFCQAMQGRRQWDYFLPPVLFAAQGGCVACGIWHDSPVTIPALWVCPFVLRPLSS